MKLISTTGIKALTTCFLLLGFGLMMAGPSVVRRPPDMTRKDYARRAATYVGGFLVAIIGSGVGAFVLVRRARAEYRRQSLENLKEVIEATRGDQLKTKAEEPSVSRKSLMGEPPVGDADDENEIDV